MNVIAKIREAFGHPQGIIVRGNKWPPNYFKNRKPLEKTMSIRFLKIKLKSLAEEQRMIRREEQKCLSYARHGKKLDAQLRCKNEYEQMHYHRTVDVRGEIRLSHLAYAYLREQTYEQVEHNGQRWFDYKRVASMVKKYGGAKYCNVDAETIYKWRKAPVHR